MSSFVARLLILDEIDVLNTKNSSILYSLFELSSKLPSGKFVLIGIGNTLNFVDKNLPFLRLQNVITFQFPSYSHNEIAEIVSQRIQSVSSIVLKKDKIFSKCLK